MAKGGKRPGAGRPVGSTVKPALRNFYTEKELQTFVATLKKQALKDPVIMKFVAEQIFGKALQPIGGSEDHPLTILFDKSFKESK